LFASVTRLRVRLILYVPRFLLGAYLAQKQATRTAGFAGGKLLVDSDRTYWTLTVWDSEQAMKKLRGSGQHGKVMRKLAHWCDEAAHAHCTIDSTDVPGWAEAYARLVADGKLSRVDHPSLRHQNREFCWPRINPEIGQTLKAKWN